MLKSRTMYRALVVGALIGFLVAIWDLAFGGFHVSVAGVRLSSWEVYKPLRFAEICALAAFWLHDRGVDERGTSWNGFERHAGLIAAAIERGAGARFQTL